jgi:serine/threonine protein kinase
MQSATVGNWITERPLGEGGMGRVYLARHQHLNTLAALKVLYASLTNDQSFRDRFLREAQTQSQLQHPNIARVIDYIEQQGQYYLVVEYLSGGTLAEVIDDTHGPIDISCALAWTKQALYALDYAHQRGVIHRDIKPSNLMFDEAGNLKVMDFGIALVMGGRRLTSTGVTMGTPEYMSPEQIARPKEVDHRTDVYSIGIVLYEMLAGRAPFGGDSDFAIRAAQVNSPPPPLRYTNPAIPEALEQAVMKALAKDPNQRYSGCGEFINALERFSTSGPLPHAAPPAAPPFPAQPYNNMNMGAPQPGYGPGTTTPITPSPWPQAPQAGYGPSTPPNTPPFQPDYGLGSQRPAGTPSPGVEMFQEMAVILMILLQIVTCGIYQYAWFLNRRRALNSLQSTEGLGSGVFVLGIVQLCTYVLVVIISAVLQSAYQ